MINFNKKKLGVTVALACIIMLFGTTQMVKASSGLKVDVFIHNAGCVINRVADITLSTSQDFTDFKSVTIPATDTVIHFQFDSGEVAVGDGIFANVDVSGLHGSGSTTNGPEQQPERIDVNVNCGRGGGGPDEARPFEPESSQLRRGETDWNNICNTLDPVLIQSCDQLVFADGTLTEDGERAKGCISNGIVLAGGGVLLQLPTPMIASILKALSTPTGCGGIVDWSSIDQVSNLGGVLQFFP
jgi:hypothetical protein